jgi:hypothetical protein
MADDARAITDYAASLFLRYFRGGELVGAASPAIDLRRDLDLLRSQWAVSTPLRDFLSYMLTHPHEAQSLLTFRRRIDDAVARGRIDARATAMLRLTSGLPSAVVADEPVRSFDTGPNQLVAWVIRHATLHASRLLDEQPVVSGYRALVGPAMADLAAVKRLDALREPLKSASAARRPGVGAIRDASRSRRPLYRHAVAAYRTLCDLEAGDEYALLQIIQDTLIAPVDIWRRFELAVAVGIGQALAEETKVPMQLNIIADGNAKPIVECGRYAIYWQNVTTHYKRPTPEPSEIKTETALAAYDKGQSIDRPDLVVVDKQAGRALAIVEVKYLEGDTAGSRFREAMAQIVRYARSYGSAGDVDTIIRRSMIAVSRDAPGLLDKSAPAPMATDFPTMQKDRLLPWVRSRLLASL